jgi:Leucine-rich repeat (LRR) protein
VKKVALVIGNGDYQNTTKLKNPTNDSSDIRKILEKLDFKVFYGENLKQIDFRRLVRDFSAQSVGSEISLFYYAGHGIQYGGRNFLVPTNSEILSEDEIPDTTISLDYIQNRMEDSKSKLNLFFLDSCRDNPFEKSIKEAGGRTANLSRGLVNPDMNFTHQSIITFATAPNEIALDNPKERNGIFTKSLLKYLGEAGLKIDDILKKTVKSVIDETNHAQIPWVHQKLYDDFYLTEKSKPVIEPKISNKPNPVISSKPNLFISNKPNPFISNKPNPFISNKPNPVIVGLDPTIYKKAIFSIVAIFFLSVGGYFGYEKYSEYKRIEMQNRIVSEIGKWSDEFNLGLPKTLEELQKIEGISAKGCCADTKEEFAKREKNRGKNLDNYYFANTGSRKISYIPKEIANLHNLQELDLQDNELTSLPKEIANLHNLQKLNLRSNELTSLPKEIANLHNLQKLNLRSNELTSLPKEIANLHNLQKLSLRSNKLTSLPKEIANLHNLQKLSLRSNKLTSLPKEIANLHNLQYLFLYDNKLTSSEEERVRRLLPNCEINFIW